MISAHWTGVREAQAAIRALGEAFEEPVLEDALKRVAEPIADEIAVKIPELTGLTADDIRVAVSREGRATGQAKVLIGARRGRGGRGFVLRFLENGTSRMAARPVLRPTWDGREADFPAALARQLRASYHKFVARFARKALR